MKCLGWVGMHLDTHTHIFTSESEPKIIQPFVIAFESPEMRLVKRMNHPSDCLGYLPGTGPKHLTFAPAATAAAEVRECLFQDLLGKPIDASHYPPLTALGRSRSSS